ncbi:MAG: tetratricopeptide repeat protein [Myxococcaceae bacterium]
MTALLLVLLTQAPNPYLDQGRTLARALQFAEAIEQLKVARQVPGLEHGQRLEVLELLARCQVAEGHREEAEDAYTELLGLEPTYQLDDKASPKMQQLFSQVKHKLYPEPWLKLLPQPAGPGEALVKVVDPYRRFAALVFQVRHDDGPWVSHNVAVEASVGRLALDVEPGHTLDWYAEVHDDSGAAVASWGSAAEPQHVVGTGSVGPVLVETGTPRLQRAPAWIAVAVAVAAAGAGAAFQVVSRNEARAAHDRTKPPGNFSDTARAAEGRAFTDAAVATGCFIGAGVAAGTGVVLFAW